jgi:hypothetical protein
MEECMKKFLLGILGATLVFGLILTGCESGTADPLSSDAALTSITVNGVEATLGTPAATWSATVPGLVGLPADKLANARVQVSPVGAGAIVYYKACKSGEIPDFVAESTFTFDYGDYLYIEVFSANHDNVLFYQVEIAEAVALINDVTVGGRSASGGTQLSGIPIPKFGNGVGTPGTAWNDENIVEGEVWYGTSQEGSEVTLEVTTKFASTNYQVATGDGSAAPVFAASSGKVTLTDGNFIYVHTSGEGGTQDAYYKIKLTAKDDNLALTSVTINNENMDIGQLGTHSFPGAEAYGNYSNGAELATTGNRSTYNAASLSALNSVTVVATPASQNAVVTYGHTTTERNYLIDFAASGTLGKLKAYEYIALEVTSELGEKGWYKFYAPISTPVVSSITVGSVMVTPGAMTVTPGTFGTTIGGSPAMVLVPPSEMGQSITLTPTLSEGFGGATVEYGFMTSGWGGPALPSTWQASGGFSDGIPSGTNVMIRVTDEDNLAGQQYYAILVAEDGPPPVDTVTIGAVGNSSSFSYDPFVTVTKLGTPNENISAVTAGAVTLKADQLVGPIRATAGAGITVTFAKTTGATPTDNDFVETTDGMYFPPYMETPPAPNYNFADGDAIWVKAVRGTYTNYYKINVTALTVSGPLLTDLLIQGDFDDATYAYGYTATATVGNPAATIESITTPGAVTLSAEKVNSEANAGGFFLVGTDDDATNSVYYTKTTGGAAPSDDAVWVTETSMDWFGMTIYIPPAMTGFANGDVLWARITSASITNYYKIIVTVVE